MRNVCRRNFLTVLLSIPVIGLIRPRQKRKAIYDILLRCRQTETRWNLNKLNGGANETI